MRRLPEWAEIQNSRPGVAALFAAVKAEHAAQDAAADYCGIGTWVERFDPALVALRLPIAEAIVTRRELLAMMPACRGQCACQRNRGANAESEQPNRCQHRYQSGQRCWQTAYAGATLCRTHANAASNQSGNGPARAPPRHP